MKDMEYARGSASDKKSLTPKQVLPMATQYESQNIMYKHTFVKQEGSKKFMKSPDDAPGAPGCAAQYKASAQSKGSSSTYNF